MSAAVDPDQLLRMFRRVSYRSALTATLATRLVPVLARDATRMSDAARCRPHPPGRLTVARAALAGALDRAVDVAAALEVRGYALGGHTAREPRPWSRHDLRVAGAAAALGLAAVAGAIAGVGSVEPYPSLEIETGPVEVVLSAVRPARHALAVRRARGAHGSGAWLSRSSSPSASATATPRRPGPRCATITLTLEPGTFTVLAGVSGSGKSTLLRALSGLVPHFHGGEASGELTVGGHERARARPGRAGRGLRHGLPGARDAGGDGRGARRAGAAARASRRAGRLGGARGRGDRARPRRGAPARPAHRHALRRRAPARGDRRGDGARPAAAGARRADLAARPGGGRRARLAAPPPERGLGHGRGDGRAPARALPAGRRPRDRDGRRRGRLRRARRASSSNGRPRSTRRSRRRRPACSRWPACARCPRR